MIVALAARAGAEQGRDSRALSQLRLSRPRRLGHRDGGAKLLRQAAQGAHAGGRRFPCRPDQGPELLQPRPLSGPRPGAARLCAEPNARGRRDRPRAHQPEIARAAGICAYKPRRDFGFHFSDQIAREAKAAAGIEAITANSYTVRSTINTQLQRALEEELQEGLRVTSAAPDGSHFDPPKATSRPPFGGSRPSIQRSTRSRPGSTRSRAHGCRSTTCIGRRRWCSKNRMVAGARLGASV